MQGVLAPAQARLVRLPFQTADLMEPPLPFEPDLFGLAEGHAVDRLEGPFCERLADDRIDMIANPGVMDLCGIPREVRFSEAHGFAGHGKDEDPFHRLIPGNIPQGGLIEGRLLEQAHASEGFTDQRVVELSGRFKPRQ